MTERARSRGRLVVVMGVAGSGKSTVGPLVAAALGVVFVDGDDYHDPANVERMHLGVPLTDDERRPWLDRLHAVLVEYERDGAVLACSALKGDYRQRLRGDLANVAFVALLVDRDALTARLSRRAGHFAGPELLDSQLSAFEVDDVLSVDGERRPREVADAILAALATRP